MSDNDIDSCLGLLREELLACLGLLLLPPLSCEEVGGGTKPKGLLVSKGVMDNPWDCGACGSCGTGGRGGEMTVADADVKELAFEAIV